jgi:hypothetical protein
MPRDLKNDIEVPVEQPVDVAPAVARDLDDRLKRFLVDPAFRAGVEVQRLDGVWGVPHKPTIYQAADGGAWLFSDHKRDLAALELGGLHAAPREQINRLYALAEAGIECDIVAIAHELPTGWTPTQRLVPDPPKSRRQREALQGFAKGIASASRATSQAAGTAAQATALATGAIAVVAIGAAVAGIAAAGAAAAPAAGAAASAPAAVLSLDPIVYGGVEQGGWVKWVELARWNWE